MARRPVIVHYHLFKNAGSSVDRILQRNFGTDGWAEIEGPNNTKVDPDALLDFIRSRPALKAVSSHTATVSVPQADDIEVLPIVFVRHPIDRIRSAYDFERQQDADTPGAKMAKSGTFQDYMEWRLDSPRPWQVSNFHAMRLKDFHTFTPAKLTHLFLPRAQEALAALPTVGLVEAFDTSMERIAQLIRTRFPDFGTQSIRVNATTDTSATLEDNLDAFRMRVGNDVYARLEAANDMDFELYHGVKERFSS